jgi:hypothetical protein
VLPIRALKNISRTRDKQQMHFYKYLQSNIIIIHQQDPDDGHRGDQSMCMNNNNNNNK